MILHLDEAARPPSLRAELGRLIDEYGPARTVGALLGALAVRTRRPRAVHPADVSAHLRRDLGLPPVPPRPDYWRHL